MTTLEQLKQEVAAALEANKAAIKEQTETARLKAQLASLTNPDLVTARAKAQLTTETTNKLKQMELACQEIINSMPIYSSKTRENRKWTPRGKWGYGNQITLLTNILSGILYSTAEHKEQMLAYTGLNEDLIEQTLEAFGNTAYFSTNYNEVIPETAYNLSQVQDCIAILEAELDINLDKSRLTDVVFNQRFSAARITAEQDKASKALSDSYANQTIAVD